MFNLGASTYRSARCAHPIAALSVALFWWAMLTIATSARGQTVAKPKPLGLSLAKIVPASVGIYAEFKILGDAKSSASTRNAYRLYEMLIGSADVHAGAARDWINWVFSGAVGVAVAAVDAVARHQAA